MFTIDQIAAGIQKELKRLDDFVQTVAQVGDDAAIAEATYKSAYARARLMIRAASKEKPTVDEIADRALELCEDSHMTYLVAQNRLVTTREALRASQSRLDGLRSLLSSFKIAGG